MCKDKMGHKTLNTRCVISTFIDGAKNLFDSLDQLSKDVLSMMGRQSRSRCRGKTFRSCDLQRPPPSRSPPPVRGFRQQEKKNRSGDLCRCSCSAVVRLSSQLVKQNNYNLDKHAKQFSITVDPNLTTIEARVLPPPRLKYHDSGREKMCHPSVGQWNFLNKRMVDGGSVDAWACINFSRLGGDVVENFCHALVSVCNNIGLSFNPNPVDVYSRPPSQIENSLREMHKQSVEVLKRMNAKHKQLQLLIIVLLDVSSLYGTIKRVCETELGIISQCCMPKNLSKCNDQYLKNLSLKINVKVGGQNTVLEDALNKHIPLVSDVPTIIFGSYL